MEQGTALSPEQVREAVHGAFATVKAKLRIPTSHRMKLPPVRFRPRSGPSDSLRGLYDPDRREFRFALPLDASPASTVVIGEEVTHFIHHAARPEVFRERARVIAASNRAARARRAASCYDLWRMLNYTEAVGLFGGLSLADDLHGASAVEGLFSSGIHLHPPSIYLDAAYMPFERKLAKPIRDMAIQRATGYALATLAWAKGKGRRNERFREFFWLDPAAFEDFLPKYDAVPRLCPGFRWKSESEVRREQKSSRTS